jgi:hypothetical protein
MAGNTVNIGSCNNVLVTAGLTKNEGKVQEILDHWNSKKLTTTTYGRIDSLDAIGKDTDTYRNLVDVAKKADRMIEIDPTFILKDSQVRRIKVEIDMHEKQLGKPLGYLESMIKIPHAIMRKTPLGNRFYEQLNRVKNYERNSVIFQAQQMKVVAKLFRAAYIEDTGKNIKGRIPDVASAVGLSGEKLGIGYGGPALTKLRKLEKKARITSDPTDLKNLSVEMDKVIASDDGAIIRDFMTLLTTPDSKWDQVIKAGVTGEVYGTNLEITKDADGRVVRNRIGTPYGANIVQAAKQSKIYLNEMGEVNKQGLLKSRDAVWIKATGLSYKDAKWAADHMPSLKRFDKAVTEAVQRIEAGMKEGGYFPQMALTDVMAQKVQFNKILDAQSASGIDLLVSDAAASLEVMVQSNPPANVKARSDVVQRRWQQNPLFVLQEYGSQAIQFNKLNVIATEYLKVQKILSNPDFQKNGVEFMEGLGKFIDDEYTIATKGLQNRPDWMNKTVRTIKIAETIFAMGGGVTGPIRNAVSMQFFIAEMGAFNMANMRQKYHKGRISSTKLKKGVEYKSLLDQIEKEQGFGFDDIAGELVTDGILSKEGAEKLDFRFNEDTGQIEAKSKGGVAWKNFEKVANATVEIGLKFHRVTENFVRKRMFRYAFIEMMESYQKQPQYWTKMGGDALDLKNYKSNKLVNKATNLALFMVNSFAGEYALHAKARILTGHPGKTKKTNIGDQIVNKGEVGVTFATSIATGLLHYPMFLADMQYQKLKGTVHGAMARQWDSPEAKYLAKYGAMYAFIQFASIMTNWDLNRIAENDTLDKLSSVIANIEGPDPDHLNADGTIKDNHQYLYGLVNEVTGPVVDRMIFHMMQAGFMGLPDSEWERIAFGYDRYLEGQNPDAVERAYWQQFGTFMGFMQNKALPAFRDGRTMDIFRHAFALYPADWTKNSREWIGQEKEVLGVKVPGMPIFSKKKKKGPPRGLLDYHGRKQEGYEEKKRNVGAHQIDKWREDLIR